MDRQRKGKVHNKLRKVQLTKVHYKLKNETDKDNELPKEFCSTASNSSALISSFSNSSFSNRINSNSSLISSFSNSSFSNRINSNSSLISSSFSTISNNSFQKAAYSFYIHTLELKIDNPNLKNNELEKHNENEKHNELEKNNEIEKNFENMIFKKKLVPLLLDRHFALAASFQLFGYKAWKEFRETSHGDHLLQDDERQRASSSASKRTA